DKTLESKPRTILTKAAVPFQTVHSLHIPTFYVSPGDSGFIALRSRAGRAIADFRFNAWAKYPDYKKDARISERAANHLDLPLLDTGGAVLEGGAIDVNGTGSILVTEECLLDPAVQVRNPGYSRGDYQAL